MCDNLPLFQELFSTYREYYTSFIYTPVAYFTVIGLTFYYGLLKDGFDKKSGKLTQVASAPLIFMLIISTANMISLWAGSCEAKTLEGNIQKISNALLKNIPKVQTPCLLSKFITIMILASIIIIVLTFYYLFTFRKRGSSSQTELSPRSTVQGSQGK